MNFGQAIASGFQRYVDFQGRSARSEFWYFFLFYYIGFFVMFMAIGTLSAIAGSDNAAANGFAGLIYLGFLGVFILQNLAIQVRRLHDTNRSGWWIFISLTIVGVIPLLIWLCTRGTVGENRFGNDPLGGTAAIPAPIISWTS